MYDLEKRLEAAGACRYPFLVRIKPSPASGGSWPRSPQLWQPHKGWSGRCLKFVFERFFSPRLTNTTNQKIVASIVELGEKLNVKVIAEYVETKEQCQLLAQLGCNLYQGYFFSKPIPLEDFIKELKRRNEPLVVCKKN